MELPKLVAEPSKFGMDAAKTFDVNCCGWTAEQPAGMRQSTGGTFPLVSHLYRAEFGVMNS